MVFCSSIHCVLYVVPRQTSASHRVHHWLIHLYERKINSFTWWMCQWLTFGFGAQVKLNRERCRQKKNVNWSQSTKVTEIFNIQYYMHHESVFFQFTHSLTLSFVPLYSLSLSLAPSQSLPFFINMFTFCHHSIVGGLQLRSSDHAFRHAFNNFICARIPLTCARLLLLLFSAGWTDDVFFLREKKNDFSF